MAQDNPPSTTLPSPTLPSTSDFPSSPDELLRYLIKHWGEEVAVITGAPVAFAVAVIATSIIIWFIFRFLHKRELAIIPNLQTELSIRDAEILRLKDRLAEKEKDIAKLESRLKENQDTPPPYSPAVPLPSHRIEQPQPVPSPPAQEQVTKCIKLLKKFPPDLPIKIVATEERRAQAQQLVEILRLADRKVLFDEDSKDSIFPARIIHNTIRLRFREIGASKDTDISSIDSLRVTNLHLSCIPLLSAMSDLLPGAERREFPDSNDFNYFQIELGGAP